MPTPRTNVSSCDTLVRNSEADIEKKLRQIRRINAAARAGVITEEQRCQLHASLGVNIAPEKLNPYHSSMYGAIVERMAHDPYPADDYEAGGGE